MTLQEIEQAVDAARADLNQVDRMATSLARLLVGRLRRVESSYLLARIKTELRDFNAHTGRWKE
jgi:hypothetical protein